MFGRKNEIDLQINQILDALLLGTTLWLSHYLRYSGLLDLPLLENIPPFDEFVWMLLAIMPFGPLLLKLQGFYQYPLEKTLATSLQQITLAAIWLVLLIGLCVIFLRLQMPSRSVLLLFTLLAPWILFTKERLLRALYLRQLAREDTRDCLLFAGEPARMQEIESFLSPTQRMEVHIVERIDLMEHPIKKLVDAIHHHSVGRVLLAFSHADLEKVQKATEVCEVEGVEAWVSMDFVKTSVARPSFGMFGGQPMLIFRATPEISWSLVLKRVMDLSLAGFSLVVFSPLFIVIALAVKWTSPGPIIFRQKRAGIHGKPFTMYKFRSMYGDAESQRTSLQRWNQMQGPVFKLDGDPRITPLGQWLRRMSLDELPQLLNVLRGEMSLVGPRPLPVYEVQDFVSPAHRRRLSMKPGLTCLWQVHGRSQLKDFEEWVRLDLEYIDNWSLALDFLVILRTIPVVILGWGAR